jgi:hypothetical protein
LPLSTVLQTVGKSFPFRTNSVQCCARSCDRSKDIFVSQCCGYWPGIDLDQSPVKISVSDCVRRTIMALPIEAKRRQRGYLTQHCCPNIN